MRMLIKALLLGCALSVTVRAQSTPLKFDEFTSNSTASYFFDDDISFKERLDRFIRQLRLERPTTKVYLIHYQARVSQRSSYDPSEWRANRAEWEITSRTKINPENVDVVDGGVRDSDTLEFWIARRNASPPKPTPTYLPSEAIVCAPISIYEQGFHLDDEQPATYSASTELKTATNFTWIASPGKILSGQGSSKIEVDVKGVDKLKVTVVVDGLLPECIRTTTQVFYIGRRPLLRDEYGQLNESDIRSRLDSFLTEVSDHPSYQGRIILYGKRSTPQSLESSMRLVMNHLAFRGFPTRRIDIVRGGYRDDTGMELWLLPPGVTPPAVRPTVDSSFVRPARAAKR